jgi:hypothetical protein
MEQYAYVDYVRPYANNEGYEAKREQKLKPGILRIQDKRFTSQSYRNRLLGKDSATVQRTQNSNFGTNPQLRDAVLESAGLERGTATAKTLMLADTRADADTNTKTTSTDLVAVAASSPLRQNSNRSRAGTTSGPSSISTSDDVLALRRQLDRVNANLRLAENERTRTIREFQQSINDLKRQSIMQDTEIRTIGNKLEVHQGALRSLRTTSAELVGTLLDMSPIFTKDRKMQQPFNMIRSKALRVHQAIEDTSERLDANGMLPPVGNEGDFSDAHSTPEKSLVNFIESTRRQSIVDQTVRMDTLDKYRNHLASDTSSTPPPPLPRGASTSRRPGASNYEEDHLPPPPPPPTMPPNFTVLASSVPTTSAPSSPTKLHQRTLSTMTPEKKIEYLFTVCLHHRQKSGRSTQFNHQPIIGSTEFLRILRDAGTLDNKFHFADAVHIFRKHSMGGGRSVTMTAKGNENREPVLSSNGFSNALASVAQIRYSDTVDNGECNRRLMSSHLGPLARYLSDNDEHGRMTYEEEKNLDHFLHLGIIEYLIKHQSALQSVFTRASGFNQSPPVEPATWVQARKNKWTMTLDQLLEYLKSIHVTPEHVRKPDLDRAMRCATAGNHLLHGTTQNEINYAQFLEILGSLAINCFAPGTSEAHRHLTTPLLRLQFLCMRVDGISAPAELSPSNLHGARAFKAAEKMMFREENAQKEDQRAIDRKRRVTLSLIGM